MMPHLKRIIACVVLALAAVALFQSVAMACPSCKESLGHSDPARANLVRGYFWSICFMMSMPFLILGGLGALFWWEVRKAKRKTASGALVAPADALHEKRELEERELVEV